MTRFCILILGLVAATFAAECPVFPSGLSNLDVTAQMGNWGIHGLIVSEGEDPKLQCLHIELSADQVSVAPINLQASIMYTYRETNVTKMESGTGTIPSLTRKNRWDATYDNVPYKFTILESGYVDYSLMIMCTVVEDRVVTQALLASRGHNQMPTQVVDGYIQYLQENLALDTTRFFPITHGHSICMH